MLARLAYRLMTELSPRIAVKMAYLWAFQGLLAMRAHRRRLKRGELFPPFFFLALTDACNLRCHGCWIQNHGKPQMLSEEDVERIIHAAKQQGSRYFTLLGGEPMLYPNWWEILSRHSDCYFQIITNGMFLNDENVDRMAAAGNVTPLISIDGLQANNDARRGDGVFETVMAGLDRMKRRKLFFGVATTVTGPNMDEVVQDAYVEEMIRRGAMYLWYYVYRPVGADPSPQFCVAKDQLLELRRRLLRLRRRHPILLIDTYWDAEGNAVCPAALGLGFHLGPSGSIEPCPPMSFAAETIRDHDGDLFATINESRFLRDFQKFVHDRTRGCVILERPQELAAFLRESGVRDTSGRDAFAELEASLARSSHDLPGEEIPEDYWFYRLLKRQLFFGMGGYG
jgi:MoaA/NifB/PqqE/SkfB family radical SAM enzyme